ncbi:MAG: hypothetical protein AB1486_32990 [Planctomycetota bacterium]
MNLIIMLLLATGAGDQPDPRKGSLEDMEILRRVLVSEVTSHLEAITGSSFYGALAGVRPDAAGDMSYWSALNTFNAYLALNGVSSDLSSRVEYIPGYGALLSLSVPVKTELVKTAKETGEKAAVDEDAATWQRFAEETQGRRHALSNYYRALGFEPDGTLSSRFFSTDASVGDAELRFSQQALDALRDTVIDTLLRFGHRVRLADGDALCVAVRLQRSARGGSTTAPLPGEGAENLDELKRRADALRAQDSMTPAQSAQQRSEGSSDPAPKGALAALASGPPLRGPSRLVIQVSADVLRAVQANRLDREGAKARIRVDSF